MNDSVEFRLISSSTMSAAATTSSSSSFLMSDLSDLDDDDFCLLQSHGDNCTSSVDPHQRKRGKTASSIALLLNATKTKDFKSKKARTATATNTTASTTLTMAMAKSKPRNRYRRQWHREFAKYVSSVSVPEGNDVACCCGCCCSSDMEEDVTDYNYQDSVANVTRADSSVTSDDDLPSRVLGRNFIQDYEQRKSSRNCCSCCCCCSVIDDDVHDKNHHANFQNNKIMMTSHDEFSSRALDPQEVDDYEQRETSLSPDMLSNLPEDILFRITSFLDAKSLLMSLGCVNRMYQRISRDDKAGWENLCHSTWRTKCHVASEAMIALTTSIMNAYRIAMEDGRTRNHITESELCYDPDTSSGTVWSFRFKKSAGTDWTDVDPWYSGLPCRKMIFLRNGSLKEVVRSIDESMTLSSTLTRHRQLRSIHLGRISHERDELSNHPNAVYFAQDHQNRRFNSTVLGTATNRRLDDSASDSEAHCSPAVNERCEWKVLEPPLPMTWRFISRPMDLPTRVETGSYIRISVGGREVPTYSVSRSKSGNWGFIMESCWGLWATFELPTKRLSHRTRSGRIRRSSHAINERGSVLRRRPNQQEGSMWVPDDDDSVNSSKSSISDSYLQDETLAITNEVQWREAFLYNVGATVLPEGDEAVEIFDQAWGGMNQ